MAVAYGCRAPQRCLTLSRGVPNPWLRLLQLWRGSKFDTLIGGFREKVVMTESSNLVIAVR